MNKTKMSSSKFASNLRKPGGGLYGWIAKLWFKRLNATLVHNTVMHCEILPDHSVLELGFGPGLGLKDASACLRNGRGKIYGMDYSPQMMQAAMTTVKDEIELEKVQLTLGNVADLPYRDASMDKVFHCNCYYFWEDRNKVLEGIHRILKPGGYMITGLCLNGLSVAQEKGLLSKEQCDHEIYMEQLKSNQFHDVKMEEFEFKNSSNKYQIIFAQKEKIEE